MIDTYIKSTSWEAMKAFLSTETEGSLIPKMNFQNLIAPKKGTAAVAASTDEQGFETPAQDAKGDPMYWYTCIRSNEAITLADDIETCDVEEGAKVVGVWA